MKVFILFFLFFTVEASSEISPVHHFKKTGYDNSSYLQTAFKKSITFNLRKYSMKMAQNSAESLKKTTIKKQMLLEKATLAGGCFWCVESDLEKLYGVKTVISGYAGGDTKSPSYKEVSSGETGHVEAVQVLFDPKQISYSQILDTFWRKINPTDKDGQFVDRGFQYSTAIFYHNEKQKKIAEQSKKELQKKGPFKEQIVTPIQAFKNFYKAEKYHQDYYKKSRLKYSFLPLPFRKRSVFEKNMGKF